MKDYRGVGEITANLRRCVLGIKLGVPVSLEVDGIDQDQSCAGCQHVLHDQVCDLLLCDPSHPVID